VQRLPVPKGGFSTPQDQHVRALGNPAGGQTQAPGVHAHGGGLRIGAALGEVKLDIHKVTNGLARDSSAGPARGNARSTVWSNGDLLPGNGVAKTYNQGNNGSGNGAGGAGGGGSAGSASAGGSGNGNAGGNGNGNGNAGGNGNGLALGLGDGNGNAGGNGNGNAGGNGNGNGNAGGTGNNGKHLGQLKH
jgi:hypothetical protein